MPSNLFAPYQSFEPGTGWTLSGLASYSTAKANTGAQSMRMRGDVGFAAESSRIERVVTGLEPGRTHVLTGYVNSSDAKPLDGTGWVHELVAGYIHEGNDVVVGRGEYWQDGTSDVFTLKNFGTFVPPLDALTLFFENTPGGGPTIQTRSYYLDDVYCALQSGEAAMIKLGERVTDALFSFYKSELPVQIAKVNTERGDTLLLETPPLENFFSYYVGERVPPGILAPAVIFDMHVAQIPFTQPNIDIDDKRAYFVATAIVRITMLNELAEDPATIERRRQRYSVALSQVCRLNPQLGGLDDNIKSAIPQEIPQIAPIERGKSHFKAEVVVPLLVDVTEVN